MSATFSENRNVTLPRYRLTVEDYHRMAEAGILDEDDRVELIEGELIQMLPIGAKHADSVKFINDVFSHQVGDDKRVSKCRVGKSEALPTNLSAGRPTPYEHKVTRCARRVGGLRREQRA